MLADAERTLSLVQEVHGGQPWHAYSTRRILEGVSAREAAAHPAGAAHSIWEILLHMTAWTREVTARLAGKEPGDPAEGDWPAVGGTTDADWRAAMSALDTAQQELSATAAKLPDSAWHEQVGRTRDQALGTGKSRLETLEGLALHHAYHAGQISLLKRAASAR